MGQDFLICSSLQQVKHDFIIADFVCCTSPGWPKCALAPKFLFGWSRDMEDGSTSQHNLKNVKLVSAGYAHKHRLDLGY